MNKIYPISTNWAPWVGIGFVLSTIFFGIVNGIVLTILVILSFLPAIVVALNLQGFYTIDNNQIQFFPNKNRVKKPISVLNIADVTHIEQVGKSLVFHVKELENITTRVKNAQLFVQDIVKQNPLITISIS